MTKQSFHIFFLFYIICKINFSQQLYQFNQYLFNDLILNPAIAGTNECKLAGLSLRKQWLGFEGSHGIQNIFFHGQFYKKTGLGIALYNDKAGAIRITGGDLDYSFLAIKNKDHLLSMGLGSTILQYSMNQADFHPETANDPVFSGSNPSKINIDFCSGLYYKNNYFLVSLGIKNLLQSKLNISSTELNKMVRQYYFTGSYYFFIHERVRCEPSLFIRSLGFTPTQIDFSSKFIFDDLYWLGLNYRLRDAIMLSGGIQIKQYTIGYGYEYTLSALNPYTLGSHEIIIRYKFCKKETDNVFNSENPKKNFRGSKSIYCPIW